MHHCHAIMEGRRRHQDSTFLNHVNNCCTQKGWLWHPHAPQMPHMNVLDLAVFPAMSKRHISMCRSQHGLRVLSPDEIWTAAGGGLEQLAEPQNCQCILRPGKQNCEKSDKTWRRQQIHWKWWLNFSWRERGFQSDENWKCRARKDGKLLNAPN